MAKAPASSDDGAKQKVTFYLDPALFARARHAAIDADLSWPSAYIAEALAERVEADEKKRRNKK